MYGTACSCPEGPYRACPRAGRGACCGGVGWRRWRRQAWSTGRWPRWWPRDRGSPSSTRRPGSGRTVTARPTSRGGRIGQVDGEREPELARVVTRLQQSYPELAEGEIHDIVRAALHGLDGARLRPLVPL